MANVVLAECTPYNGSIDSFQKELRNSLVEHGNSVLILDSSKLFDNYETSNALSQTVESSRIAEAIEDFKPDLILSLNHWGIFAELLEISQCPIAIWLLDSPVRTAQSKFLLRNSARYIISATAKSWARQLEKDLNLPANSINYLPYCSDLRSEALNKRRELSYVQNFRNCELILNRMQQLAKKDRDWLRFGHLVKSYDLEPELNFAKRLERFQLSEYLDDTYEASIINLLGNSHDLAYLTDLTDFDLHIYGQNNWLQTAMFNTQLSLHYDAQIVDSRQQLANVYNTSIGILNLAEPSDLGGISKRVFDALASTGQLITEDLDDLPELFHSELPVRTFKSPEQAKATLVSLLKEEGAQEQRTKNANEIIDAEHRFKHRLATLSEVTGINLIADKVGSIQQLEGRSVQSDEMLVRTLYEASKPSGVTPEIRFTLQAFHSYDSNFAGQVAEQASQMVAIGSTAELEIIIRNTKTFLRLDVGDYFSFHKNPVLLIRPLHPNESQAHTIDLASNIIQSNQFAYENKSLVCGFDAFCIFKNPFPSQDVTLTFRSQICSGI